MKNPITNDVFDSRDLLEFKSDLEEQILDAYIDWADDHNVFKDEDTEDLEIPSTYDEIEFIDEEAFTSGCSDLIEEYEEIKNFCEQFESYGDFEHGETIIHRDYFQEYCEEFVRDVGYINSDLPSFIERNIDWEGVADEMEIDYMEATYHREYYLMRA